MHMWRSSCRSAAAFRRSGGHFSRKKIAPTMCTPLTVPLKKNEFVIAWHTNCDGSRAHQRAKFPRSTRHKSHDDAAAADAATTLLHRKEGWRSTAGSEDIEIPSIIVVAELRFAASRHAAPHLGPKCAGTMGHRWVCHPVRASGDKRSRRSDTRFQNVLGVKTF